MIINFPTPLDRIERDLERLFGRSKDLVKIALGGNVNKLCDMRLPENVGFRQMIQVLRMTEFNYSENGQPEFANVIREAIKELVANHNSRTRCWACGIPVEREGACGFCTDDMNAKERDEII